MEKKLIHPVFFEDRYGKEHAIAEAKNMDEAYDAMYDFCAERNFSIPYLRFWIEDKPNDEEPCYALTFDVGSWSEFFHIYFDKKEQAEKFITTAD